MCNFIIIRTTPLSLQFSANSNNGRKILYVEFMGRVIFTTKISHSKFYVLCAAVEWPINVENLTYENTLDYLGDRFTTEDIKKKHSVDRR